MRICLVSYGDFDYDGRLRGLYDVCLRLGEVSAFTRGSEARDGGHHVFQGSYGQFIKFVVNGMKETGDADLLLLDNRKSIIPGLLGRNYVRPQLTVLDCRELYISKDVKHFAGKIGCLVEGIGVKQVDCLIAANHDRAEFMQASLNLGELPLVYENLRKLNGGTFQVEQEARLSIQSLLKPDEVRIVSTGGCDPNRLSLEMVEAMARVERPSRLYLVGAYTQQESNGVLELVANLGLNNVEIVGQLSQAELKCLLDNSHIGLVGYHQKDLNNKYCASGKVYEYLYEGLPIVASSNPPLRRLCAEGVGVSSESYASGINEIIANYDVYRKNVLDFTQIHSIEENDEELVTGLRCRLNAKRANRDEV